MYGGGAERASLKCVSTPRAAKMEAYSHPITPAPTTARLAGILPICRIVSLSQTYSSSNGTVDGRYGEDPVAIRTIVPSRVSWPSEFFTTTRVGDSNRAETWK